MSNVDGSTDDDNLDADPIPGTPEAIAAAKIAILRGVDRASAFSVTEAKTLLNKHAVKYIGVYIGGPCDGGSGWTKDVVTNISHATGFKFAPVYVGQQEAAICGADRVTAAQGKADGKAAAADMKKFGWEANRDIPVVLDLEAGTYYHSPSAATAYVNAWINEVHAEGYRAYVYSTPFGLNMFHDKKLRIDGVWAASYFYKGSRERRARRSRSDGQPLPPLEPLVAVRGRLRAEPASATSTPTWSHMLLAPKPGGTNRATTAHREVPATCGSLQPTEGIAAGESASSCDGNTTLSLSARRQLDADVELARPCGRCRPTAARTAVLEDNGEFAIFDADDNLLYNAGTFGFPDGGTTIGNGELDPRRRRFGAAVELEVGHVGRRRSRAQRRRRRRIYPAVILELAVLVTRRSRASHR